MHIGSKPVPPHGEVELFDGGDLLYRLAEFSVHGVALCDAQLYCRYANPALQSITGYPMEELARAPIDALLKIPPHTLASSSNESAFPIVRMDGATIKVLCSCLPVHSAQANMYLLQVKPANAEHAERQAYQLQLTLQMAAEAAGIGTWEEDLTNGICTVCPVGASILGLPYACSRMSLEEWRSQILDEDLPLIEEAKEDALRREGTYNAEFRQRRKDGKIVWLTIRGLVQFDELNRPVRVAGIMLDTTEHKRLQEQDRRRAEEARAAAEANAKFRAFFYQGSNYAGLLAVDGTLLEVNAFSLAACGFTEQQVLGRKFWQCGWWSRSHRIQSHVKKACEHAAAGHIFRGETLYFMADGSEHISDMTLAPVIGETGEVLYIAATGIDITDRKRAYLAMRASEERYRLLAEMSPDAILVETEGAIIYANPAAAQMLGKEGANNLLGIHIEDLVPEEFQEAVQEKRELIRTGKSVPVLELRVRRLDGKEVEAQASCGQVVWEGEVAVQILLRDMTEIRKARERLRIANERLKLAIEGSGQVIWDWDVASNTFSFTGGLGNALIGASSGSGIAAEWVNLIHPDDVQRVLWAFEEAKQDRVPLYECEYRLRDNEGNWRWIWARGVIVERDSKGKPLTMMGTLSDITVRKESDELAWRHANLDALTGLPNRRLFRERLEMELARLKRHGYSLALLFIDLDGFKQVNDVCGHDTGDLVLMEVAYRLKCCVRETDTVARLGGDEFTIMLTELSELPHVELVCQKILSSLSDVFYVGQETAYLSCSIGVALYPEDAKNADELLRKADQAMYAAKYSGKNQFHYFTKEMDDTAHLRLHVTNELRQALASGQLYVHYQPVVDLQSGSVVKAEALLRWTHPVLGEVGPAQFIPLAEEAGLIQKLGNWVFREAALCSKRCSELGGQPFQIGVNKSPMQLMARDADDDWLLFLDEIGLSGQGISVEITENALLRFTSTVSDKLLNYRNAGIEVAIDDFGTGYSSMAYLHKFNIDYVKIDQSFVQCVSSDNGCRAIAEAIITMAHKLGKKVIAEGIETEEQKVIMREAGCDYGQGFLFSKAVSEERLLAMVEQRNRPSVSNKFQRDLPPAI